jgi:lipopolysaccharide biosynthesis protein
MTESWQHGQHLQSYFLVFGRQVLSSAAFRQFFAGVLDYRSKKQAILAYELGLSAFLLEAGFRGGAAFPGARLAPTLLADVLVRRTRPWAFRRTKNPTLYYPDRLLAAGMPYVKVDLLRRYRWRAMLLGVRRRLRDQDLRGLLASP